MLLRCQYDLENKIVECQLESVSKHVRYLSRYFTAVCWDLNTWMSLQASCPDWLNVPQSNRCLNEANQFRQLDQSNRNCHLPIYGIIFLPNGPKYGQSFQHFQRYTNWQANTNMSEQARRKHFYFKAKLNEVSAESQTDTFSSQLGRFFMSHLVDCQWPCVLVATPLYGDHLKPTVTIWNCFVYNSSKKVSIL